MEQFQQKWSRFWQVVIVLATVLSVVATAMAGLNFAANQAEEPVVARGASVNCYMEQGGEKFVGESGCELELQSGATLDIQSGATTGFGGDTALGDGAGDTATLTGDMVLNGYRDGTSGYDYFMTIQGDMAGLEAGAKTYGAYINLTRQAADDTTGGDIDDAGLKIQVTNKAETNTAGNTLRAINANAKNDNPSGSITNLIGGLISIQTDTGSPPAGNVSVGKALEVNTTVNAPVTDTLMIADFRNFRQTATEPTQEIGVRIRNSSTTGTGADAALWIDSDGTTPKSDWGYGIDMVGADIATADLRLENGETIDNGTDTVISVSAFLGATEQTPLVLTEGDTITPTGTYQPITSASAITTSATTAIANGVKNGQMLILVNENASDAIIVKDSANTHLSGDITLGNDDTLTLIWDGADWVELATSNNS